jgi:hypothetical protein
MISDEVEISVELAVEKRTKWLPTKGWLALGLFDGARP